MSKGKISILGLYYSDPDLFVNLHLPEALNSDVVIDNLLMETAELECIYPDADFMKLAIGSWSLKELEVWQKLYETTVFDYNPIWNKDGTVTETESISREGQTNNVRTTEGSRNGTTSSSEAEETQNSDVKTNESGSTETLTVAGFDESTFQNREKTVTDSSGTDSDVASGSRETSGSGTTSDSYNDTGVDSGSHNDDETREYSRTEQGNIGVTSTQQLIREEREVDLFNIYDEIIQSFKRRFCVLVY